MASFTVILESFLCTWSNHRNLAGEQESGRNRPGRLLFLLSDLLLRRRRILPRGILPRPVAAETLPHLVKHSREFLPVDPLRKLHARPLKQRAELFGDLV